MVLPVSGDGVPPGGRRYAVLGGSDATLSSSRSRFPTLPDTLPPPPPPPPGSVLRARGARDGIRTTSNSSRISMPFLLSNTHPAPFASFAKLVPSKNKLFEASNTVPKSNICPVFSASKPGETRTNVPPGYTTL
jgi:hypothetical protein